MGLNENTSNAGVDETAEMSMFRAPIVRSGTAALNRALFSKKVNLAAAAVKDNKLISQYRPRLNAGKEILNVDRISPIQNHPDKALADQGRKCLLLNPSVKPEGQRTHQVSVHTIEIGC